LQEFVDGKAKPLERPEVRSDSHKTTA
jgi:hypothetical protein